MIRLPDHAATLQAIGETDAEAFYTGDIARKIDAESRKYGGYLRYEDLAAYAPQWVEPIRVNYRGYEVCEIPPNGQGIVALMALNILKEFTFEDRDSVKTVHRQLEAMKMAFADAFRYVTDPEAMEIDYHDLLSPAYGAMRAREMGDRAQVWTHRLPPKSGTVYLCCADGEGNMVSYIQSNYMGFGSGIVVEGTGIALQNRGADFSLDPKGGQLPPPRQAQLPHHHPRLPHEGRRPGGPLRGHGRLYAAPGPCAGGDEPRGLPHGSPAGPGRAPLPVDAGRQRHRGEPLRSGAGPGPAAAGATISAWIWTAPSFGRGQMIVRLDNGVLVGGTESRTDSNIACCSDGILRCMSADFAVQPGKNC